MGAFEYDFRVVDGEGNGRFIAREIFQIVGGLSHSFVSDDGGVEGAGIAAELTQIQIHETVKLLCIGDPLAEHEITFVRNLEGGALMATLTVRRPPKALKDYAFHAQVTLFHEDVKGIFIYKVWPEMATEFTRRITNDVYNFINGGSNAVTA